jgi:hypothetical protein
MGDITTIGLDPATNVSKFGRASWGLEPAQRRILGHVS